MDGAASGEVYGAVYGELISKVSFALTKYCNVNINDSSSISHSNVSAKVLIVRQTNAYVCCPTPPIQWKERLDSTWPNYAYSGAWRSTWRRNFKSKLYSNDIVQFESNCVIFPLVTARFLRTCYYCVRLQLTFVSRLPQSTGRSSCIPLSQIMNLYIDMYIELLVIVHVVTEPTVLEPVFLRPVVIKPVVIELVGFWACGYRACSYRACSYRACSYIACSYRAYNSRACSSSACSCTACNYTVCS